MIKRKTIGRILVPVIKEDDSQSSRVFTLKSGRKAKFSFATIEAGEVSTKTFVDESINGRIQSNLTRDSVEKICDTIKVQQFFPAIGMVKDGLIEILDGSRRRAATIFENTKLEIWVTQDEISYADAKQLASDIQTAKEHNTREFGLSLLPMIAQGFEQIDISKKLGLSPAKVSRAIKAARVDVRLINVFPLVEELSHPDYTKLTEIQSLLESANYCISEFLTNIESDLDSIPSSLPSDEFKNAILRVLLTLKEKSPKSTEQSLIRALHQFDSKDKYARIKIKGRSVNFEFKGLAKKLTAGLEEAICDILEKNLID
ncbi:MAG: ParB family protein [Colwellia sp.]